MQERGEEREPGTEGSRIRAVRSESPCPCRANGKNVPGEWQRSERHWGVKQLFPCIRRSTSRRESF